MAHHLFKTITLLKSAIGLIGLNQMHAIITRTNHDIILMIEYYKFR